jgi:hypothetical protein
MLVDLLRSALEDHTAFDIGYPQGVLRSNVPATT